MMQAPSPPPTPLAKARGMHSANTINALIFLLSDQDQRIARQIHHQIMNMGPEALPFLRHARERIPLGLTRGCRDHLLAQRLHAVIADLVHADIEQQWITLLAPSPQDVDLEIGAFLIAQAGDPHADMAPWRQCLDDMAATLTHLVAPSHSPRHNVLAINEYLFQTLQFRGNTRDYYDPDNSFLHRVLARRVGIPISLSVLYLLLSQRLNVPVIGVGVPGHFLVRLQTEPLFIDCFNRGKLLTERDCARVFRNSGVAFDHRHVVPCSHDRILARMLRNLIAICDNRHETAERQRWNRLLTLLQHRELPSHSP